MAKKTLGYVELEWTCPNCGHQNPGSLAKCDNCGAPQPADVDFRQAEGAEISAEREAEKGGVEHAPDIHCPYCGTRNPAGTTQCRHCGGDLSEGALRRAGRVLGEYDDAPAPDVTCPYCGTVNPASNLRCTNCNGTLAEAAPVEAVEQPAAPQPAARTGGSSRLWLVLLGILGLAFVAFLFLMFRTTDIEGRVVATSWRREQTIEAFLPVSRETWLDELPGEAELGACQDRLHHTQPDPAPNAVEVCGEPYTVDLGDGFGEVVQDCEYEVYELWCEYSVEEWQVVDTVALTGNDLQPQWPSIQPESGQRLGAQTAEYDIVFSVDGRRYTYSTRDPATFATFVEGSVWELQTNALGGIVSVSPR